LLQQRGLKFWIPQLPEVRKQLAKLSLYILYLIIGIEFWKCPRRKLYAISSNDLQSSRQSSSNASLDESSDSTPVRKKQKVEDIDLLLLTNEIKAVKDTLQDFLQKQTVSRGLKKLLLDHFKCQICRDIIEPPVIITTCCCTILGCQDCVEQWYRSEDSCPSCRAEDQKDDLTKLRGLNELLLKIKELSEQED